MGRYKDHVGCQLYRTMVNLEQHTQPAGSTAVFYSDLQPRV